MADPLYVKRLTTNLKTADGVTVDMGPRVLIVGPNESGKSALAQSLLLATTGVCSGLLFRKGSVKASDQIATMIPDGEGSIEIRAELSNGDVAIFQQGHGHKAQHSKPASIGIGVDEVREAFSGSADTAKKFLVDCLIAVNVDMADVRLTLKTDDMKTLFDETLGDRKKLNGSGFIAFMDNIDKTRKLYKTRAAGAAVVMNLLGKAASPVNEELLSQAWHQAEHAAFAQWFKDQGKLLTALPEEERPAALGPLRWLSKTLGGKDALAIAKPVPDARKLIEQAIAGNALYNFVHHTMQAAAKEQEQESRYELLLESVTSYFNEYLVVIAIDTFIERTQNFLPSDEKFTLNIDKMYPGLIRDGETHYALSGSTEARVLAAMCCALNGPGKLSVVVVDDRMWDGMTLAKTLKALERAPCMVVMMSTMLPRGRARASWTFIELTGPEAEEPGAPKGGGELPPCISPNSPTTAVEADGASPDSFELDFEE